MLNGTDIMTINHQLNHLFELTILCLSTMIANMYNCMADCEEDQNLLKKEEIRNCLNICANTHVSPKRDIVDTEVKRLTTLIHKELDDCLDKACRTINNPNYKEGKIGNQSTKLLIKKLDV